MHHTDFLTASSLFLAALAIGVLFCNCVAVIHERAFLHLTEREHLRDDDGYDSHVSAPA